jgi:hypothetical protein
LGLTPKLGFRRAGTEQDASYIHFSGTRTALTLNIRSMGTVDLNYQPQAACDARRPLPGAWVALCENFTKNSEQAPDRTPSNMHHSHFTAHRKVPDAGRGPE